MNFLGCKKLNLTKIKSFLFFVFLTFFSFSYPTFALPSSELTYHGKLTNLSDVPVTDGNYDFVFKIYDASSGGNCLWVSRGGSCGSPTAKSIAVNKGIFYTILGESGDNALTLDFNSDYWLEIQVGTNSPMTPRRKITGNNFSLNSGKLNGQSSSYFLDTSATEQTKSGNLNLSSNLALTGIFKDKDGDAGTSGQVLSSTGTATDWITVSSGGSSISDADTDTKIQTEESADEDYLRFDTAGTERMYIDNTGKIVLPSNTNALTTAGVIYKGSNPFIHNFNYGNNGSVTTEGKNTFIGENAGNFTMGATATIFYQSSYNTAIGYEAMKSATKAAQNTAIGHQSMYSITTGLENTAIGDSALYSNQTGGVNTMIGFKSGYYTTADSNTGIGSQALYNNTTGYNNTAIGEQSLKYNTTGYNNTAIGYSAGNLTGAGPSNNTSVSSVYVGNNTKASANGNTNEIVIGYDTTGNGSNTVTLGNSSITNVKTSGTLTLDSVTYPKVDGTAGQVLKTDGAGVLSFVDVNSLTSAYGEMYQNDNVTATTINTINVWEEINNFSSGELGGVTFANSDLTVTGAGKYKVNVSVSGIPQTANDVFEFAVSVNDVIVTKTKAHRKFSSGTDAGSVSLNGILNLSANNVVKLEIRNTAGADDFTIENCNLTLNKI